MAQLDNAADSDSEERGFKSLRAGQKKTIPKNRLFYPLRKQWYIATRRVHTISRQAVYHHQKRIRFHNDDMQNLVLMIYNFCEIDNMHSYAVIVILSVINNRIGQHNLRFRGLFVFSVLFVLLSVIYFHHSVLALFGLL